MICPHCKRALESDREKTEERQKQEILRLGALLSTATESAARYQAQVIQFEQKLKRVREALR